jgi:TetR/AcrR family transcriptional repressor of nem operon
MVKLIEFDIDKALENSMLLFWRQGYNATSLSQLLEAMAISRSCVYEGRAAGVGIRRRKYYAYG